MALRQTTSGGGLKFIRDLHSMSITKLNAKIFNRLRKLSEIIVCILHLKKTNINK